MLSTGVLRQLYEGMPCRFKEPVLQLLDFETSDTNPNEIIIRISDSANFIDCVLIGPYRLHEGVIQCTHMAYQTMFHKFDIIKLTDFYSKIDETRICRLKIVIRKLTQCSQSRKLLGAPIEIAAAMQQDMNPVSNTQTTRDNSPKRAKNVRFDEAPTIKCEYIADDQPLPREREIPKTQLQDNLTHMRDNNKKSELFMGRLIRMTSTIRNTAKDGIMTVLYLGVLDKDNNLARINLIGRVAIKEEKLLKKGRVYSFKGLDLIRKAQCSAYRVREREYEIVEVTNQAATSEFGHEYYYWEHETTMENADSVDVIGVIDQIEQKTTYKNNGNAQLDGMRDVVRILVRNRFKTIKVSFWADQIKQVEQLNMKKRREVILLDLRKKKSIFLDYTTESSVIFLDEIPSLRQKFIEMLPRPNEIPDPTNLHELSRLYDEDPADVKVRNFNVYICQLYPSKLIYKMCDNCKKKTQLELEVCQQCLGNSFSYKYNCFMEICDATGSIGCVVFDGIGTRLFGMTAREMSQLSIEDVEKCLNALLYNEISLSLEYKLQRVVVRFLDTSSFDATETVISNLKKLRENLGKQVSSSVATLSPHAEINIKNEVVEPQQ